MSEPSDKMLPPRDPAEGSEKSVSSKPTFLQRMKRPAIWLGVVMLAFVGGFLWAKVAGNQALSEAKSEYETTLSSKDTALQESDTALSRSQARVQILAAYRDLHLALMALEERNFGTANDHLNRAAKTLTAVSEPGAGEGEVQIAHQVGEAILAWKPDVSQDVGKQRHTVLGFAGRLDPLVGAGSD